MKSAFECLQYAVKCEDMATAASNQTDKTKLLATAQHWRALGENAKFLKRCEITGRCAKTVADSSL